MLHVGGGSATYSIAFAQAGAELQAVVLDRPEVRHCAGTHATRTFRHSVRRRGAGSQPARASQARSSAAHGAAPQGFHHDWWAADPS